MNMNCFGRRKVKKHKEIKGNEKIATLNISAKFDIMKKIKTTSSESKVKVGRSGKGLVTALVFKTKVRFHQNTKRQGKPSEMSARRTFQRLSKNLRKFGKVTYVKRIPKHEPTSSYFHLVRCVAKCMMRSHFIPT